MKNMIQRIFRGILSVIATFVLMAAPIAAVVYSSDSTLEQVESSSKPAKYTVSSQTQTNGDAQEWAMQQDPADGKKIAMVKKKGIDTWRQSTYTIPGGEKHAL